MSSRATCALLTLGVLAVAGCRRKEAPTVAPAVPGQSVVAEIIACSKIPDPARSDYPDCLFSASARVHGRGNGADVPEKILVMLQAFKGRKLDPAAALKPGDLVKLRLLAEREAPKDLRESQRSDTLSDFTLPVYYASGVQPAATATAAVSGLEEAGSDGVRQAGRPGRAPAGVRYPWSPKAAAVRRLVMEQDIAGIREGLERHGGTFEAWQNGLRPMLDDLFRQGRRAQGGVLKQGPYYFEHLRDGDYARICAQADRGEGPFKMLVSMSRQLRARGVDLIAIPYPQKEEVNADMFTELAPQDGVFEPWRLNFILKLLEADVEVLELIPALRAARATTPDVFYPVHDGHPADSGLRAAAKAIATRLERYELLTRPGFVPKKFGSAKVGFATNHREKDAPMREYLATEITWADGSFIRDEDDDSHTPVLVLGDSFTAVPKPYGARNASICYQLAPYLGELPDLLASMGGAPQFLKVMAREGGSLFEGRCVAVFMFSPNALLNDSTDEEAQWSVIDLPEMAAKRPAAR